MSVTQMAAVFKHSRSKGSARLVLLALADVASETGEVTAYARSYNVLANKANVDVRTVTRCIKELCELGELRRLSRGNGRASSDYTIAIEGGQVVTPAPTNDPPRVGKVSPQGGQGVTPISTSLPVDDSSPPITSATSSREGENANEGLPVQLPPREGQGRKHRGAPPGQPEGADAIAFDEFWHCYPRKVGKGAARPAFLKAIKRAPAALIIEGVQRYAEEVRGKQQQYIAHPATWLNGERWLDEPGSNAARPKRSAHVDAITTDRGCPEGVIDFWTEA